MANEKQVYCVDYNDIRQAEKHLLFTPRGNIPAYYYCEMKNGCEINYALCPECRTAPDLAFYDNKTCYYICTNGACHNKMSPGDIVLKRGLLLMDKYCPAAATNL